jgi:hypothetical protein
VEPPVDDQNQHILVDEPVPYPASDRRSVRCGSLAGLVAAYSRPSSCFGVW